MSATDLAARGGWNSSGDRVAAYMQREPNNPRLSDRETSDAIHRADFARGALADPTADDYPHNWGDVVETQTTAAGAVADHVCGVTRVDDGPDPARGTLRWYQVYIAELDRRADTLAPGWRTEPRVCGPSVWADEHFGPVNPAGDQPEMPREMYEHAARVVLSATEQPDGTLRVDGAR